MEKTEEQKELDEELLRECEGYGEDDDKPDGAYIKRRGMFFNMNKIKRLIEMGADVNAKDEWGYSPLHWASWNNNIALAKLLISAGADVNAEDGIDGSPLHRTDSVEVAKLLISAGADVNAEDGIDGSPLHVAVRRKNIALVEYLISAGANVNAKDKRGDSPLDLLLLSDKNLKIVKLLIKAGITE